MGSLVSATRRREECLELKEGLGASRNTIKRDYPVFKLLRWLLGRSPAVV